MVIKKKKKNCTYDFYLILNKQNLKFYQIEKEIKLRKFENLNIFNIESKIC